MQIGCTDADMLLPRYRSRRSEGDYWRNLGHWYAGEDGRKIAHENHHIFMASLFHTVCSKRRDRWWTMMCRMRMLFRRRSGEPRLGWQHCRPAKAPRHF